MKKIIVMDAPEKFEFKFNKPWDQIKKEEDTYIDSLKGTCRKKYPKSKKSYQGKEVMFPYADGYARYLVANETDRLIILWHLAVGDAWEFPYLHNMDGQAVHEQIDRQEKLSKMFKKVPA